VDAFSLKRVQGGLCGRNPRAVLRLKGGLQIFASAAKVGFRQQNNIFGLVSYAQYCWTSDGEGVPRLTGTYLRLCTVPNLD
jgi:hypothetical protein